MAEAHSDRKGVLLPVCVGAGSVALLTVAGVLPALYLAGGVAGGWYIGKRIRGDDKKEVRMRQAAEQAAFDAEAGDLVDEDSDDSSDSSDGEDETALADSILAGANMSLFMQSMEGAPGAESIAIPPAAKEKVQAGIHQAFEKMPQADVVRLLGTFEKMSSQPQERPTLEALQELRRLVDQVQQNMPADALATMKAYNQAFLPTETAAGG
mmetsp:Transcript_22609/g.52712  ORF Transcript_22609/g.52712 Transcript_22609/m.52712 type:complete len:210 (-) Transcript_22609:55-684(-)